MTANAIIYEGLKTDRHIKDFQHQLDKCDTFAEIGPNLLEVVQKMIGASCITLFPLYRGAVPKPDVAIHSEYVAPNIAGMQTIAALPVVDKELESITHFIESKTRTRNLVEYYGRNFWEKAKVYNEYLRPFKADQSIVAAMGTKQSPLGFIGLARSNEESRFTDRDVILTERIRSETECAIQRIMQSNGDTAPCSEILSLLGSCLPINCAVLDKDGHLVWASKTARQKLGEHVLSVSDNYFLCAKSRVIEIWKNAIQQSQSPTSHQSETLMGLVVSRIESPPGDPLYLVIETETDMNRQSSWRVLSAREKEIAELAAQGYSPLNIGALLSISVGTVRVHLKNIYRKLNVSSRMELALRFQL